MEDCSQHKRTRRNAKRQDESQSALHDALEEQAMSLDRQMKVERKERPRPQVRTYFYQSVSTFHDSRGQRFLIAVTNGGSKQPVVMTFGDSINARLTSHRGDSAAMHFQNVPGADFHFGLVAR
jgi:hypothetical protein